MREAGILQCRRGSTGGYRLHRGDRVTVGDVIRAVAPSRRFAPCCASPDDAGCALCSFLDARAEDFERAIDAIVLVDDPCAGGCAADDQSD